MWNHQNILNKENEWILVLEQYGVALSNIVATTYIEN